jgi:hypothetical protein
VADQYWVNGKTIVFVTTDHQRITAPVSSVDLTLSQRLNREQNVAFVLPPPAVLRCWNVRPLPGVTATNALAAPLVARHGKGYFVYTSLAWFRQLPEAVPGAYRLFANLVSLGK